VVIQPSNLDELSQLVAAAHRRGERITGFKLNSLARVLEHTPEDMTVSAEAGITLATFQSYVGRRGQWLPVDPPKAERLTIGALLATNTSGPRRFGYGAVRDYLIGIKVVLADGRIVKAGGKVVKNVAGFDLCKLFVGSHGTLGIIAEATFKLRPLPEKEQFVQATCETIEQSRSLLGSVGESELTPVILDLHNLAPRAAQDCAPSTLVLGFAGTSEEVDWQIAKSKEIGIGEPSNLDYETAFWGEAHPMPPHRSSVLPSKLLETLHDLGQIRFLARAGNGLVYCRGGPPPAKRTLPSELMQRIKTAYDPKHILPEFPP
jgi:FAD/FMN-containing dehydrogenase